MEGKMKLYLIGMMGSGKTTLGKALADKLNYQFIDMDVYIENEVKMSI
ncbi:MAG: AAA family ATPase, partial [Acholeplasmatales bacterium]|nr:AAA family ATPase [Acholeplasmatales bacterium]